ncbi:MAG: FxsA family protein [Gammaproteobacteria bacterium]|nr:FxsA family protein [Gammaproteobacteria bacterium]
MPYLILPLIIAFPLLELYVLIKAGGVLGAIPTIALVVFSAVLGTLLLRWQGWIALQRVRAALARGELPARELLDGLMVLVGGVLLLIPGFISDLLAFLCLIPAVRRLVIRVFVPARPPSPPPAGPDRRPRILEGEYREERIED